jgi:hypothetical protein
MGKMNPEIKEKWLKALRSGEYAQGKCQLRRWNSFCCLGVLCDVIDASKWGKHKPHNEGFVYEDGHSASLPESIMEKAKITDYEQDYLMDMNDGTPQRSFIEIADWIEESL